MVEHSVVERSVIKRSVGKAIPSPGHDQVVRAPKSRLATGWSVLFFKPPCQRRTADPKDALDGSHIEKLIIGGKNLLLLLFGISATWLEHTAFAAILAPKLLTAAGVVPVLDNVGTAAPPAQMDNLLCQHSHFDSATTKFFESSTKSAFEDGQHKLKFLP